MYQSPKQGKCSTVVRQRMQARKRPQPSRSTAAAAAATAATAATAAASASISVRRTAIFSSKSAPSVHSSSRWILRVSANSSTAANAYDHPCTRRILCIPSRTSVSYPTATTTASGLKPSKRHRTKFAQMAHSDGDANNKEARRHVILHVPL